MTQAQIKRKVDSIFNSKPNGREKEYLESIYWGVGKNPYADKRDCSRAGINIKKGKVSPSGAWYYLTKSEAEKLIKYLTK